MYGLTAKGRALPLNDANRVWVVYAVTCGLVLFWLLAIIAAPWLMSHGYEMTAAVLYRGFGLVCHQRSARSFHLSGWPLAVCARCLGIYAGVLLGLALYPLWRNLNAPVVPARRYLVLACAPLLIDWALGVLGIVASHAALRMATGMLAGGVAAFYVLPIWLSLARGRASFAQASSSE